MHLHHDALYTADNGEIIHIAFLNGYWIGLLKSGEPVAYDEDGTAWSMLVDEPRPSLNIKGKFRGWINQEFDWPEWAGFVTWCEVHGVEFWRDSPYIDSGCWAINESYEDSVNWMQVEYQPRFYGNWKNSLLAKPECDVVT